MKIYHVSDLHANHHVPFTPNQEKWKTNTQQWMKEVLQGVTGEVLILNGDFSEWNCQSLWLFEEAAKHFEQVLVTLGNHDYYLLSKNQRNKYKTSFGRIDELFKEASKIPNVVILQKRLHTFKGVTFAGDTMWYDLPTPEDYAFYENISNDSNFISTGIPFKKTYKVLHDLSMDWYYALAGKEVDVFVSHIPPVQPSMSSYSYNACYVTPVPFLVGKHWLAGHQHVQGSFEKAGQHFHMNAYGYPGEVKDYQLRFFEV